MKAVVYTEYGPPEVLQLKEVAQPVPKENEVLVRVRAASVAYGDLIARNFKHLPASAFHMPLLLKLFTRLYFGWNKPKIGILGSEFAGEIEAVGRQVTRFQPGERVMGYLGMRMGAYAETVCLPETGMLARMPAGMSFAQAASLPYGAIMASSLLRKANLKPGQSVLIVGASGGIGSAALQLARHFGARVTAVCATPRLEYVKTLGAEQVIDYTREDFTHNGQTYDLIFDVLGMSSFARCKHALKPGGIYFLASFKTKALFQMLWTRLVGGKQVICAMASEKAEDLDFVRELVEAGRYQVVVDRTFPLAQAAEAHLYAEAGQKKGNVVITL